MNCATDEATLILRRWYRNRSDLLHDFQASIDAERVRMRGRISQLDADRFLFVSSAGSVSVPFDSTGFEYGECSTEELSRREKPQRTFCSLQLWLSIATVEEAQSGATALASPLLNITETIS
jgi:hypothetical protein